MEHPHFPLLELPVELRNQIYSFAFDTHIELACDDFYVNRPFRREWPALFACNQQIRTEAIEQYYRHTTFSYTGAEALSRWLATFTPKQRARLGHLRAPLCWRDVRSAKGFLDTVLTILERRGVGVQREVLFIVLQGEGMVSLIDLDKMFATSKS